LDTNPQHIIDYLEDKLPEKERELFENRLNNSEELQHELNEIRFIRETSEKLKLHHQINTEKNWKELAGKIKINRYKTKLWHFIRTGAAVLLLPFILSTFSLYQALQKRDTIPVEQIIVTSAPGLVTKTTLPDGSEVWLNSSSTLSYPQRFTSNIRRVRLAGEAYFKVKADKTNRFEVSVNDELTVSAYGTEFNVCAYEEEQTIEATLVSGRIEAAVKDQPGATTIEPGQQALFDKETRRLTTAMINPTVKTAWKDGKMVFRRASMTEITRRLSHRFNVDIRLEGEELYDYAYSATFTTETLDEILYLLEKTAPIKCRITVPEQAEDYTYSKRTVIISMHK